MRLRSTALAAVVAAALAAAPARADDAAREYAQRRFEVQGDKVLRNHAEVPLSAFFAEIGRKDLVDKVKDAQSSGLGLGIGLGVTGAGLCAAGWGAFVGLTIYGSTSTDPSVIGWAAPAAVISALAGSCLCPVGLGAGGLIAGLPYLEEESPVDAAGLKRLSDEYNAKLRAQLGVQTAMSF